MAERQIKFRGFHYYVEREVLGQKVLNEKMAFFGDVVDIPLEEDLLRGEELGAFFTDEEREAIQDGTYDGPDAETLKLRFSTNAPGLGFPTIPAFNEAEAAAAAERAGGSPKASEAAIDAETASTEELAEYIKSNKLKVNETIALAKGDPDLAEKIMDAEEMATGEMRPTVESGLQDIIDAGLGNGGGEPAGEGPEATEEATALAEEHGIDLGSIEGTGQDGRILKSDVEALIGE